MTIQRLGFIGLGVMGEPMCRNLAERGGLPVLAHDLDPAPVERLADAGVVGLASIAEVAAAADLVLLSLPGGDELEAVCQGPDGLLANCPVGGVVVDTSTMPVDLVRDLGRRFAEAGVDFADAPVSRTRHAARDGTLSIMVGASPPTFERVRPVLAHMGTQVTHCGDVGAGQVVKLMNNMVLMETVVALAEALAIGRRAGVDGKVLFDTLAKGSANSFALRNHGLKAMLPGDFPERAFSTRYARKDLAYALRLAAEVGIEPTGARTADAVLAASAEAGNADLYHPALIKVIDPDAG